MELSALVKEQIEPTMKHSIAWGNIERRIVPSVLRIDLQPRSFVPSIVYNGVHFSLTFSKILFLRINRYSGPKGLGYHILLLATGIRRMGGTRGGCGEMDDQVLQGIG